MPSGDHTFRSLSLTRSSTVDKVADELRRALFDGELEAGTALRESALAEAMGVARSTIREALAVLVAEGLATREPNRGVYVTGLDRDSVHDVCLSRTVLEIAGIRRWADAGEAPRDAVRTALTDFTLAARSDASPTDLTATHLAIHRSLAALTESPRLTALADTLCAEIRLGLARVDRIRRNSEEQVASHQHLVALLERGDVDAATRELEEHLAHAEASMLTALDLPDDRTDDG